MSTVTSKDGTSIAYDRQGNGPAVVLVGGALIDPVTGGAGRAENAPLATELAKWFTVYNYDRRGRAESGDTPPYALEREIEDLDAVIAEAGGVAHLYGVSSGGALVLEAAAAGGAVGKLAVYEVPYMIGEDRVQRWQAYVEGLGPVLAEGRRGDAVAHFMRLVGSSEEEIAGARTSPLWDASAAVEHTLVYDAACVGDGPPPGARLAAITRPTLVATGGSMDFMEEAADAVAASLPRAERLTLQGQSHLVDAKALAPVLERFFR